MKRTPKSSCFKRVCLVERATLSLVAGILCVCVVAGASVADPPAELLDAPFYSFDAESPTINPELPPVTELDADDILELNAVADAPNVAVDGTELGLGLPGDELDALSSSNADLDAAREFLLLFSIDRASVANLPPDGQLVLDNVPYNALEQALKGHASGDQFMALDQFTQAGGPTSADGGSRALRTSVQLRNQHNEGGSDFGGEPESGSARPGARLSGPPLLQDNVVSMMLTGRSGGMGELVEAYFSVTADSPSLITLPGDDGQTANGAYIFFYNANAIPPEDTTTLFASSADLGLGATDDINAMIVFDANTNGVFDGNDQVLFSLAPDSPSLDTIPQHSAVAAAADVFAVTASVTSASLFAPAENLGLGVMAGSPDNVDALDYVTCVISGHPDPSDRDCARQYGIRGGSVPAVSGWGIVMLTLFVLTAGGVVIRRTSRRAA